ncbi:helix-turn-helix domain-containing protein [Barnesiella intestinihominis]|uniref:helix-turn-helix domain-containing protein n=1 Tax=Barnesiella intestinihominis TaxID=487174 RepID=UPI00242C55E5|nr:helix-turn-helix transcriptional regulator [Barnesiella intestinihominis]
MLFAQRIKSAREESGLLQRQLASMLDIDIPMYSRIERGDRQAKREQVILLSRIFHIEQDELLSLWVADKVYTVIKNEIDVADKALNIVVKNRIWK